MTTRPRRFCTQCATEIAYSAVFCPSCGFRMEAIAEPQPRSDLPAAGGSIPGQYGGLPWATIAIALVNIAVYGTMVARTGRLDFSAAFLLDWGGNLALRTFGGQYWRLLTAAFLHVSLTHIASNMVCLLAWGVFVERRIGTRWFLVLYACFAVTAGLASAMFNGSAVSIGASGAISGLLGVMVILRLRGDPSVQVGMLAANIMLNIGLAFTGLHVDWVAHATGFFAGLLGGSVVPLPQAHRLRQSVEIGLPGGEAPAVPPRRSRAPATFALAGLALVALAAVTAAYANLSWEEARVRAAISDELVKMGVDAAVVGVELDRFGVLRGGHNAAVTVSNGREPLSLSPCVRGICLWSCEAQLDGADLLKLATY